jgi:methylated-DNA-[protein]-cysteine S-methyltransferase
MSNEKTYYTTMNSPVGKILLAGNADGLSYIDLQSGPHSIEPAAEWVEDEGFFSEAIAQLEAYFSGELQQFELPLAAEGTPFQQEVWRALVDIPYGETISYGELAAKLGKPGAARAVGLANGRNPLPIVVPCHRVIGSDGSLTGYGGGLDIKRALLALEQDHSATAERPVQGELQLEV